MASLSATITQGCAASGGVLTLTAVDAGPGAGANTAYTWAVLNSIGTDYGSAFDPVQLPISASGLPNDTYQVRVNAFDPDTNTSYTSRLFSFSLSCAATGSGLQLDSLAHTDETAARHDGTATVQASGGVAPLTAEVVETGATQPATSGAPLTFSGLAPGTYTVRVTDSSTPTAESVQGTVVVAAYSAPVVGCLDEYATNYDPAATSDPAPSVCTYAPRWRSAWQDMAVRVAATAGQIAGYLSANLRIGFRPGHPLAAVRPLGASLLLRATVGPDGYATFRLGPYLRPQLGAPDGSGGYRLDLNSATAYTDDLYVGYELRNLTGELLEHGYALNAAVPDAALTEELLSPFAVSPPMWPGFDKYAIAVRGSSGRFGFLTQVDADARAESMYLPCPPHPLPVAWLAPGGGFGFWVFQGRAELGDSVEDGQRYREAGSGERRYSSRGEARRTVTASSGVFAGADLLAGLRTLWASPQVWYQPVPDGPWVAVTLESGSFPAGRSGLLRNEVKVTLTEAAAQYSQGQ